MADSLCTIYEKPLRIAQLEEQLSENVSHKPGDLALALLGDVVGDWKDTLTTLRKRCAKASCDKDDVARVPMHPVIMNQIIRPLKEAKQCFVLGMPIACIAQAGLVGEMVAIWRFDMLQPDVGSRLQDDDVQKIMGNRDFDHLGQEKRVKVLKLVDDLDDDVKKTFGNLRGLRRKYLHFMVKEDTSKVDEDARQALRYANLLVSKTLDCSVSSDGRLVIPPMVVRYILEILRPSD